jgi:hypothetical protein
MMKLDSPKKIAKKKPYGMCGPRAKPKTGLGFERLRVNEIGNYIRRTDYKPAIAQLDTIKGKPSRKVACDIAHTIPFMTLPKEASGLKAFLQANSDVTIKY